MKTESRKKLDAYIKKMLIDGTGGPADIKKKKLVLPERGQLYEYLYQLKSNLLDGEWIPWVDLIDKSEIISPKLRA